MNRYQEYFDNPPKPLNDIRLVMIEDEGEKRRKSDIKKHGNQKNAGEGNGQTITNETVAS